MSQQAPRTRLVDLLSVALNTLRAGSLVAYCRIVETRGSTPQKAGAVMLVQRGGMQHGTIGGGCVEAEVSTRALVALDRSKPEVATFTLNSDYGWDDGLICGGRMRIAIEPLACLEEALYLEQFLEHLRSRKGGTEAIVCGAGHPPSFLLFDEAKQLVAAHRLSPEMDLEPILKQLQPLDDRPRAYEAGGVAYVPIFPRCRLIIVGGGHVGRAVAQLAADLDFDICVVDDRAEFANEQRFPGATEIQIGPTDYVLPKLDIDGSCYCLIVTRGHKQDEKSLFHLIDRGARYVGLIGSRRKINLIFEDLIEQGVSAQALARVHAPVGIDIGSQTVAEIAVSIAAELVAHRNCGGAVPGRPESVRVLA